MPATAGPPNILLLMLDSLDGRLLDPESSVYGEVELPHLRAFASTAVNFVRAYSANPVCVPSRTAMLTGRLPHLLHVFSNSDGLAASNGSSILDARCVRLHGAAHCSALRGVQHGATTLLEELAARHYDVRAFGKLDVGSVCSENVACDSDWNGFHANPKEHWCTLVRAADVRKMQTPVPRPQPTDSPEQQPDYRRDADTVQGCVDALRSYASWEAEPAAAVAAETALLPGGGERRRRRRPFFLYCDLDYPHAPYWEVTPRLAASVNWSAAFPPAAWRTPPPHPYDLAMSVARGVVAAAADPDEDAPDDGAQVAGAHGGGGGGGGGFGAPPSEEHAASFRAAHLAKCAQADAFAGEVLAAAAAVQRNTLVAVASDHGEMRLPSTPPPTPTPPPPPAPAPALTSR